MNNLYRIKPLEWEMGGPLMRSSGCYHIELVDDGQWRWSYVTAYDFHHVKVPTLPEAYAAVEAHRRKLLEAELEPAYQPTTDLPTEPGLYWWRLSDKHERIGVILTERCGFTVPWVNYSREMWEKEMGVGQWIRIPEPEG